jgi:hypothetical protein
MRHSLTFQMRSDKFAEAAERLGPGGGLSGFARFYAMLANQERTIELEDDRLLDVALRGAPQEDASRDEDGAGGAGNDFCIGHDYRRHPTRRKRLS